MATRQYVHPISESKSWVKVSQKCNKLFCTIKSPWDMQLYVSGVCDALQCNGYSTSVFCQPLVALRNVE